MTFQALNSALSGLRVAQQQLNTISNNVANATTPGYTRKILPQSSQVINSTGQIIGVKADTMIRNVDLNLEKELWTQISAVSALDTKAAYLDRIEKFHGPTNKELSIAAQIAQLKDKFAALSDSPGEGSLLQSTLNQAITVANKFNEFGQLITDLRNEAQDDMAETLTRINNILQTVADLNGQIKASYATGRTIAGIEDQRDEAIKELSTLIDLTMFTRGDNAIVLQTSTGAQLADEVATELYFDPTALGATTTYPLSAAGVYVGGNPITVPSAFDVTQTNLGGKLGGLIEMRDETLMRYQTHIDEMAHKLALRLEAQGLRLFTDPSGVVPLDTPPDTTIGTPVTYVGFASVIQVNQNIRNDITLLQQGTYVSDVAIPTASNEVIRRVIEFGFGTVNYQEIEGDTDLNFVGPATDLQTWLGLTSTNNVVQGIDFSNYSQIDDGLPGGNDIADDLQDYFPNWPNQDQFRITFSEPRLGLGPVTIGLDLSSAGIIHPIGPGINDALDQIIAEINDQITIAGLPAGLTAAATRNTYGQLVINSSGNVTYDASSFPGGMGTDAFEALGLNEGTYITEDPYFDIRIGNKEFFRITIEPGEDVTDLIAKLEYNPATLTGVPGLYVDFNVLTGFITLRPGIDDSNGGRNFGGDMRIISGPGTTTSAVNPALAALPSGVNVVSALFGSYTVAGPTVTQINAVEDVLYASETEVGSGIFVPFRRDFLGPGFDTSTRILSGQGIIDFSQKVVNAHAQDVILNDNAIADEGTLRDVLQERFLNESTVNIDEELSMLIVIQTAYAASARAVSAASEMFDELLAAI